MARRHRSNMIALLQSKRRSLPTTSATSIADVLVELCPSARQLCHVSWLRVKTPKRPYRVIATGKWRIRNKRLMRPVTYQLGYMERVFYGALHIDEPRWDVNECVTLWETSTQEIYPTAKHAAQCYIIGDIAV